MTIHHPNEHRDLRPRETTMRKTLIALALAAPFAASGAALAHHSGAMFEPTLTRELHGTIKEF
jgi:hypothetical protein